MIFLGQLTTHSQIVIFLTTLVASLTISRTFARWVLKTTLCTAFKLIITHYLLLLL